MEFQSATDLRGRLRVFFGRHHCAFHCQRPDPLIFPIGGSIGISAIWFNPEYPQARLTVSEADPALVAVLQRNLAAAAITDVKVEAAAVWTADSTSTLDNQGLVKGAIRGRRGITVRAVDLASHLPARVDLLKLDGEGTEHPIVGRLHATGALRRLFPVGSWQILGAALISGREDAKRAAAMGGVGRRRVEESGAKKPCVRWHEVVRAELFRRWAPARAAPPAAETT